MIGSHLKSRAFSVEEAGKVARKQLLVMAAQNF